MKVTGWMQSGELQRRVIVVGNVGWLARLRGKGRKGWSVEDRQWQPNSNMAWAERSSGRMVPASAGGG